ncbi:MAG: ABC transporter permease [Streptosporangiaceae bacterium]
MSSETVTTVLPEVSESDLAGSDHLLRRLLRHRSAQIGLVLLVFYALLIGVCPWLTRDNPSSSAIYQNLAASLEPMSAKHWLGTDQFGRDELVRIINGGRYTLFIGFSSVLVGLIVGVPLGALSGFFGGWVDTVLQRIIDIVLSFPGFLLALALVAALGSGLRNVVIAVAVTSFPRFARLLRASILTTRELQFVESARALGASQWRTLVRHALPNSLAPIVVQTPLELGSAILTAAGLGFLGLGVAQPTPEWGSMLGNARDLIFSNSTLITFPGLAIVGIILAFNLIGDALRDALDPRIGRELAS